MGLSAWGLNQDDSFGKNPEMRGTPAGAAIVATPLGALGNLPRRPTMRALEDGEA